MKILILILLSVVLAGACATEEIPTESSPNLAELDDRYINGDGGVCSDSSGQPCFCGSIGCDDGGIHGPGGGTGGGGGGGSPTTPFPTCFNQVQCWPESCVTPTYACQLCQTVRQCSDGTTTTRDEYNCYQTDYCD